MLSGVRVPTTITIGLETEVVAKIAVSDTRKGDVLWTISSTA
jgi:hypothetical protein